MQDNLIPFSLQPTEVFLEHSQTFLVRLFGQKKLTAKSCELFLQKSSAVDFWSGSKYSF